ncbi:A/G-specific adenine glycosylase [Reyranella sp. CPCC 100927]|uniref:A/G-specific adenine glycosylase n=1 Tax=Reyranella sp. CPCC 100927 TaxID=2599616 RepID=UPI0011B54625|nr:A/G-specific adenine glycosylase [Reyranella sp. CPCC 100927]TWT02797.1 A/G-specific adenine glycosylase [Reyranella sp. CPCC 100927]
MRDTVETITELPEGPTPEVHAGRLLPWYDRHRRTLPWRALPGEKADPYRVWLSEIMLQQTTVVTVGAYFDAFLHRWPTVRDLAAAPLDKILHAWQGLGYYARARNLHACAQAVVERHGGQFPDDIEALSALPGVGAYTAGAIAAIAFDRQASAVDGNVERVIARLYALETPLPDVKPAIRDYAGRLVPAERPGDYAQAMMDLGATVCTPRAPRCVLCPVVDLCVGRRLGVAETLPRRRVKPARPVRQGIAFLLMRKDGAVLLRRRPPRGLLGGMIEVPSSPWREGTLDRDDCLSAAPVPASWRSLPGIVRHVFTHFELRLEVVAASTAGMADEVADAQWCAIDRLDEMALPTVMKKVLTHGLKAMADANPAAT